jgi:hypothetical protein
MPQGVVDSEDWQGEGTNCNAILITSGQRIIHSVQLAGPVLNREIIPEQPGHPCVLRNCRQALIQQNFKLQWLVQKVKA